MRIVKPSAVIEGCLDGDEIVRNIERIGRVCYKSEEKITPASAQKFVESIVKNGHHSVLEHEAVTVRIVCDRGISHELVRHRIASFSQESTRYVSYGTNSRQCSFIKPFFLVGKPDRYAVWLKAVEACQAAYQTLIDYGATPQEARSVLPNSTKTEIVITANLREWRHVFELRTSPKAHPQMREIMIPLLKEFQRRIPIVFDDIEVKE